jgi:hypothetical protein
MLSPSSWVHNILDQSTEFLLGQPNVLDDLFEERSRDVEKGRMG